MKLSSFCSKELIEFDLKSTDKDSVLAELATLLSRSKLVKERDELHKAILEREKLVTTGVGFGVAFPHAKTKSAKGIVIAFGRSKNGIAFDAMDKKPVHLFFTIAAPDDLIGTHLNVMARLSFLMKDKHNRDLLMETSDPQEVLDLIDQLDESPR